MIHLFMSKIFIQIFNIIQFQIFKIMKHLLINLILQKKMKINIH